MIHSMTAFARSQGDHGRFHLVWELKSVNHRFLETQFRMPDALRALEPACRDVARRHLKRGKVDCTLRLERAATEAAFEVNRPLLLQLLATLEQMRRDAPDIGHVNPLDLMRWPGVLQDASADDKALQALAQELFEKALADLLSHREREGGQLSEALFERLNAIENIVTEVRGVTQNLTQTIQNKLKNRVKELEANVEPARFEQEVALLAQRADVAEEIDRLGIHVEEARASLRGKGPHGRRLDFLTQELNREANTLGAKSVLPETSQRAVDLKVLIEQIREQVQNIE